jgi:hypothetical protein
MIFPITRKFTIFTTSNGQRYVGATESVNTKRIAFDIQSEIEYSNKHEALKNCTSSIFKKNDKFDYFGQGIILPAD